MTMIVPTLYFITGNPDKFREAQSIIPEIKRLEIDPVEIQGLNPQEIIQAKAEGIFSDPKFDINEYKNSKFVVEDISLIFDGMNGLPGPLIKWFLKSIDNEGLHKMAQSFNVKSATARSMLGLITSPEKIEYFTAEIKGQIVAPRGDNGFGWDFIFQPDGYEQTFAEMGAEEKNKISMRKMAFIKLKQGILK